MKGAVEHAGQDACRRRRACRRARARAPRSEVRSCRRRRTRAVRRRRPSREQLDRIQDLHVAGAAAQVGAEMARRVLASEVGALLRDQRLRAHHDAGRAEAALQARRSTRRRGRSARAPRSGMPSSVVIAGRRSWRATSGSSPAPCRRAAPCNSRTGPTASTRPSARGPRAPRAARRAGGDGRHGTRPSAVEHEGDRFGADHHSLRSVTGWNGPRRVEHDRQVRVTPGHGGPVRAPGSDPGLR